MVILPLLQVDDFTQSPFSAESGAQRPPWVGLVGPGPSLGPPWALPNDHGPRYGADQVMESFKEGWGGKALLHDAYPLIMTNIAIENGP